MTFNTEHILHGGDYNPEQWLHYPDIFDKDIALMKQANINTVTLGMFMWSSIEPQEGEWSFGWLDSVIDRLGASGIAVILATPSGARPRWLADSYPEVMRVDAERRRQLYGFRHNHCYTSPAYRERVRAVNMQLAARYGGHPAVILWHLSNEYGGECHCPLCQAEFRNWLARRYGSIDELNKRWCTTFWSHSYNSFEQVESPSPIGETQLHALNLDWKRFVTERTADFIRHEVAAIRDGGSSKPITTNLMYNYVGLDYSKIAPLLDVVSWDTYPVWHKHSGELVATDTAMQHDYMRSLKNQPFLLMESCPSATNWQSVSKLKRPGMLRAASLQAVAHGSDSVLYFQIRQSLGASEKLHGAVIDHYGEADTRVFGEVTDTGNAVAGLAELSGSRTHAEVAVIYDTENRWAIEDSQGPRNAGISYKHTALKSYRALCRLGLNVDVVDQSRPLEGYKLVAVPMSYLFHNGFPEHLRAFVAAGGRLLLTYHSGVVDEHDRCFLGGVPHELLDVTGLRVTETDALYDGDCNHIAAVAGNELGLHGDYYCDTICELTRLWTAVPLGVYTDDFYKGTSAVSMNKFGKGEVYVVSADAEQRLYDDLVAGIAGRTKLPVVDQLPAGVSLTTRQSSTHRYIFAQNFADEPAQLPQLTRRGEVIYHDSGYSNGLLPSLGTVIIREKR